MCAGDACTITRAGEVFSTVREPQQAGRHARWQREVRVLRTLCRPEGWCRRVEQPRCLGGGEAGASRVGARIPECEQP